METYLVILQVILIIELAVFAYAIIRGIIIITNAVKNVNGVLKRKEIEIDSIVNTVDSTLVTVDSLTKHVDQMMPDVKGTVKSINVITEDVEAVTNFSKDIASEAKEMSERANAESEKIVEVFAKVSDLLGGKDE